VTATVPLSMPSVLPFRKPGFRHYLCVCRRIFGQSLIPLVGFNSVMLKFSHTRHVGYIKMLDIRYIYQAEVTIDSWNEL
jgi:hypothetical protein